MQQPISHRSRLIACRLNEVLSPKMIIHFSDCGTVWEQVLVWILVVSILIAIVSALLLFSSEKTLEWKKDKKAVLLDELLGPFHTLVSSRYLTAQGAKWRRVFLGAVFAIVFNIGLQSAFNACVPIT